MKRIATAALALSLLSGTAALADPQQHNDTGHNNTGHNNGGQPHYNPHTFTPHNYQGWQQNVQHNTPQVFEHNVQGPPNPQQNNVPQVYEHQFHGAPTTTFHPEFGAPGFHPGSERPRYNPEFFPRIFHPRERFEWREGYWRGPPGWYYRTWFYGQILPWGWFAQDYWIGDYWDYDLPVPPYGYEWVRNGPDALLVNIRTGFVAEVVPGIFY